MTLRAATPVAGKLRPVRVPLSRANMPHFFVLNPSTNPC